MADLDYAFLADFAQIEGGKLSVIGGSYTHARVESDSGIWLTSVAGRVRSHIDSPPLDLSIVIKGPGGSYEVVQNATLEVGEDARPYGDGKVGILFATTFALPILELGLFTVELRLDSELVRTLAFDMSVGS